ncbi:MAG: dipeptidase [Eubacteriales bacterium]
MYIVDAHCDSIQLVDEGKFPLVNPRNFSSEHNQLQFVAMFTRAKDGVLEEAYKKTVRYIGHFAIEMQKEKDKIVQVRTYADIERAFAEGKHAALLAIEGGSGIKGSARILKDFYDVGVRVFGIAWLSNELAKSNRLADGEEDTGMTELGREIIEAGNELGMIYDVSHLSDKSFWDLAELSKKPIIATHSNFRTLCPHSRNLTDEMARHIVENDGIIGLNMYPEFIDVDKSKQTVDRFFDHLDYCVDKFGSDNVGFGGDIDGTGGMYPSPITEDYSIHDQFLDAMVARGYSSTFIEKFAGLNFLNFLKKYL